MFTLITNHYLPEITPINTFIIHLKKNIYTTCTPFFKLLSNFSRKNNFKTWGEHTEKSSIDNALELGIYRLLGKRLCTR